MNGGGRDVVAGHRLVRPIGRGTDGSVHLAEHIDTGAAVALKLVPLQGPEQAKVFLERAQAARRLVHPGIVALYGAGLVDGGSTGWLAMEPVPGSDLARYTQRARLLPEPLVLKVAERVAAALAHAHAQGVVHRDLKPANVLADWPSDTVKVADLGLARSDDGRRTATGVVLGSPAYMAPEQLAGAVPTPASDLHALGAMLFELLTARLPYEGATMGELLRRVAAEPAPALRSLRPELPSELDRLVARLLAKQPAARPAGAAAVAAELRQLAALWPLPQHR